MNEPRIRLLIVEDHTVVREALCALLGGERYGIEVIGDAADGEEGVVKALSLRPDVILMDIQMPRKSGIEATEEICRRNPAARVLILTSSGEPAKVRLALSVGAMGYILKQSSSEELVHAIRSVYLGQLVLPPTLARPAIAAELGSGAPPSAYLTNRELHVLRAMAGGLSNQEIADHLSVTTFTVRSHVHSILSKLNLTNRTQAAMYAVEAGLARQGGA